MLPPLLLLTDRTLLPLGRDLRSTVASCADAGLEAVVLRELDLPEPERAELAEALAAYVQVISARTALPAAKGVHLHATQPAGDIGDVSLRGRSCHGTDDVRRAADEGADYVTLSPVDASRSKPGYGPPLGTSGVRSAVAMAAGMPVFALGGVEPANAAGWRAAGAAGVAVMGAVMRAVDPAVVVRRLLEQVR